MAVLGDSTATKLTVLNGIIGEGSQITGLNASNIASGTLAADRLATSGATAGNYGPGSNASPAHGASFSVPYFTVDNKGRITTAATRTITLPSDNNTDIYVKQNASTTASWQKVLLHGVANSINGAVPATTATEVYAAVGIEVQPSSGTLKAQVLATKVSFSSIADTENGINFYNGSNIVGHVGTNTNPDMGLFANRLIYIRPGNGAILNSGGVIFSTTSTCAGTDSSIDLGAPSSHWKGIYSDNIYVSTDTGYTGSTAGKAGASIAGDGYIELVGSSPYIDFHYNKNANDYTARIIADAESRIKLIGRTTPTAVSYNSRSIHPLLDIEGNTYATGYIDSAEYFLNNRNTTGGGYYLYGNNVEYAHLYINTIGEAPTATTADGTVTYAGAKTGAAWLMLGNGRVSGNNENGVANNARGYLRLFHSDSSYTDISSETWTGHHLNVVGSTTSTAGYTGSSIVIVGNASKKSEAKASSTGAIRLYSDENGYHLINTTSVTSNITHTLPASTGWLATGATAGVGSSTKPVYMSSAGVLTAIDSYDGVATSSNYLNLYEARASTTTLNKAANYVGAGKMFHLVASSSTSSTDNGKPPMGDANVLQMNWDNNGGYDAQLAIHTTDNRMEFRSRASQKQVWREVVTSTPGTAAGSTSQPVYISETGVATAITGALANDITGNANTATTAGYATTAARASTAGYATTAARATTAGYSITAANATTAGKLGTANVGTEYKPIYLVNGVATANHAFIPETGGTFTGDVNFNGNVSLNNETTADSLTAGSLLVNGAANFVQSPTAPTPAASSNDTTIATTAFVKNSAVASAAILSTSGTTDQFWRGDNAWSNEFVASPNANVPIIKLTSNKTPATATYQHGFHYLVPNMVGNSGAGIAIGKSADTGNSIWLGLQWQGSNNNASYIDLGFWGANGLVKIYKNGGVSIGGSSNSYKLHVNGTSYLGGNTVINGATTANGAITVAGNVLPSATRTRYLGSSSLYWKGAYIFGDGNIHPATYHTDNDWGDKYSISSPYRGYPALKWYSDGHLGNGFFGIPAEATTVEYTTDGGTTWTVNENITVDQKMQLTSETACFMPTGNYTASYDAGSNNTVTLAVGYGVRVTLDLSIENRAGWINDIMTFWRSRGNQGIITIDIYNITNDAWTQIESQSLPNTSEWYLQTYLRYGYYMNGNKTNDTTNVRYFTKIRFTLILTSVHDNTGANYVRYAPGLGMVWANAYSTVSFGINTTYKYGYRTAWSMARYNAPIYLDNKRGMGSARIPVGDLYIGDDTRYTAANTEKWTTIYIGNGSNVNAENAHSQGRVYLYSAGTKAHIIRGASTTTDYTHYFPNSTGWIATGGNGTSTGAGSSTQPVYLGSNGVLTAITGAIANDITGTAAAASQLTSLTSTDNASSSDHWRKIWMTYADGTTGRPAISTNLTFQTSTNTLKANHFLAEHTNGGVNEFRVTYGSTVDMAMMVGSGNENHGLYDNKANKWMIYADTSGNVTVNGTATTAGYATTAARATTAGYATTAAAATKATQDGDGNTISSSYLKLTTAQTVSGTKTFSAIQKFTNTTDAAHSTDTAAAVSVSGGVSVTKRVAAKEVKIDNGSTTKGVTMQYDSTLEVLNFVFA